MKPRAILFDWDGTLADVYPITRDTINYVLLAKGDPPLSEADAQVKSGWPLEKLFPDAKDRQLFIAEHQRRPQATPPEPMLGANELLRYVRTVKNNGKPIFTGIISNKPHALIEEEMRRFGWDGLFDTIVGSDDVPKRKPDPTPMTRALEAHSSPQPIVQSQILYVGDTDTDCTFARNCGIQFVGVGDKFTVPLAPNEQCSSFSQLLARLQLKRIMNTSAQR